MSAKALWELVKRVGERDGMPAGTKPHSLPHTFAESMARYAGLHSAQILLGHAVATAEIYLGTPTVDELVGAVEGFALGLPERAFYPLANQAAIPVEATTGIEPV